jgi:hypothetical protein
MQEREETTNRLFEDMDYEMGPIVKVIKLITQYKIHKYFLQRV